MDNQQMEAGRKADSDQAIELKLQTPNDSLASKPANSAAKNGKTIFASQNVSLDIPRNSSRYSLGGFKVNF